MDVLDKLLAFSQISAGLNVKCQLQGKWQLDNPYQDRQAVAHIVSQGSAYLYHNGETIQLNQGDIVFFPKSADHALRSQIEPVSVKTVINQAELGGFTLVQSGNTQSECDLFCLHFHYDSQADLMDNLPEMLIFKATETPLNAILSLLRQEGDDPGFASKSVVNSLALVILTMIFRQYLTHHERETVGVLKAWQDTRLRPLMREILLNPELSWQIEEMAAIIHLSRSQLIRLFNKNLGISPHAFVHKIRLQKAAMLLKSQPDSVLSIALACGFQSEPHFITAFKKAYGETPSQYRQSKSN
ncbi:AraC family transcriptional regulator [Mannheimia varigena USDA-ARS-USMARC-1388]|uniref:helix-turn-helix domain-containing protein n=1 Tax=Mannheimia varigena TaxID=85404 RepID=UPI0003E3EAD1|nr:AraC family transcriptional regulator [Mannheimia varigena]AHG80004.1 AraC family transcriptional regulator [Mannheimia varigena USDA-ARS-USMARC-1388]